jgi:hypothetical protein
MANLSDINFNINFGGSGSDTSPTPLPAPTFHIRKRKGYIEVNGSWTATNMAGVKLWVFRQQKGTIGRFFVGHVPYTDNFVDLAAAQSAVGQFAFDLALIDGKYKFRLRRINSTGGDFLDNSDIEKVFFKIVKRKIIQLPNNQALQDYYIGRNNSNTVRGKYPFVLGEKTQSDRYYNLFVALTKDNKVISNYIKIFAYYNAYDNSNSFDSKYVFVR